MNFIDKNYELFIIYVDLINQNFFTSLFFVSSLIPFPPFYSKRNFKFDFSKFHRNINNLFSRSRSIIR